LSGQDDALFQLYKVLPHAIKDYLNALETQTGVRENSALDEIKAEVKTTNRSILDQITFENYNYYLDFDKL
jgi:hypothetical protein